MRPVISLEQMSDMGTLLNGIWDPGDGAFVISVGVLRTLAAAGSYVYGAYEGDQMLGACIGVWGDSRESTFYSHIAGVAEIARTRRVGFAMKVHQRAWALDRGLETMVWTFDPLISRNAYFNFCKLGCQSSTYLTNHYGAISSGSDGTDETDRLMVEWSLSSPTVERCVVGDPVESGVDGSTLVALSEDDAGRPVLHDVSGSDVLVRIPRDIDRIRRTDAGCASAWRLAVRETLGNLLSRGGRVVGFDQRQTGYVVR